MAAAAAADQCPPAAPLFPNFGPMMSYMPAASYMQAGGASAQMTPPLYWNSAAVDMKPPLMPFGAGTSGSMPQPLLQEAAGPSEQGAFTTLVNSVRGSNGIKVDGSSVVQLTQLSNCRQCSIA